jgi:hypothetical protein
VEVAVFDTNAEIRMGSFHTSKGVFPASQKERVAFAEATASHQIPWCESYFGWFESYLVTKVQDFWHIGKILGQFS